MNSLQTTMLHITVGTAPGAELNLLNDLRMVKAGILYADRVKLCSPAYSILLPMLELGEQSIEERLDFLERILPYMGYSAEQQQLVLDNINKQRELFRPSEFDLSKVFAKLQAKNQLNRQWEQLKRKYKPLGQDIAAKEFKRAVEANILEVHSFQTLEEADVRNRGIYTDLNATTIKVVKEFVDVLGKTVVDGSTYPLFDESTAKEIQKRIENGELELRELRAKQAKQSNLAANLLSRLPLLEEVPVDEIIDIRRELENPLHRFRSGIITYANEIKSAPWNEDFSVEAEQLFIEKIGPAILEIEETLTTQSSFAGLALRRTNTAVLASGGVLSAVVGFSSLLSPFAAVAVGGGLVASSVLYEAYKDWQKQNVDVEKNQLYFYYKVIKRITDQDA
jgi:hypothetical protein